MRIRHLDEVLSIEEAVFPEPWSESLYQSELARRSGCCYLVAKSARRIVGYIGLLYAADEAHVATIAVSPLSQRQRIGTRLLVEGARRASDAGVSRLILEVATTNEAAQALYRRFGFAPVGVRENYYQRSGEDAYVMIAEGIDTPDYARRLKAIEAGCR